MNILRLGRNVTIIAFLVSLLFHGSTFLYIFLQKTSNSLRNQIEQEEQTQELQKLQKDDPWVATQARASNFGSPVFFKDEPEQEQTTETIQQESSHTETSQEETPQHENTVAEQQEIVTKDETSFQDVIKTVPIITQKKASAKKIAPPKKYSQPTNKASIQTTQNKPPLSLAQLTQGFLNQVKDEGSYGVSILSNKSGLPSEQQLKYERYLQKLGWCLQNSYNINSDRCPPVTKDTAAHVFLALNRDGTVKHLNMAQSSGNIHLDQFTLFIFRDASSSFPPIPHYLPDNPFAITYVISIGAPQDSSMRFYRR